ncbi:MAG: hypothetical protein A2161_01605 [Candidatus Schekmanbacteria bacterium RBG_13_48_7]|uniref:Uncharacterized protein n=1 Tax=Candidatus Schekmanbacteria bacterium RBG_13_48_7 TaxID=1817878 RepID=A0A1F7RP28_9BACT|nr:MAG: hypothetical protein A2161_01605 [Candidatus Schekmanbacteria bacterium RBG_13_48_7]
MKKQLIWLNSIIILIIFLVPGCSSLDRINPESGTSDEIDNTLNTLSILLVATCDAEKSCIKFASNPKAYEDGRGYYNDGWWIYDEENKFGRIHMQCQYISKNKVIQDYFDSETQWVSFNSEIENYVSGLLYNLNLVRTSPTFFNATWVMNGDGFFRISGYSGTIEVDDTLQNAIHLSKCPTQGLYTLVFPPYLATMSLEFEGYADGTLKKGNESYRFYIDLETGEITR